MQLQRVYNELYPSQKFPDYFRHPTKPIWLSKTEDYVVIADTKFGVADGGEYKTFGKDHLHVLKAETFLKKPTTKLKLMVNHIDGDKFNNDLDNIEWVTAHGNIVHAFQENLRDDNLQTYCEDLTTGEKTLFLSLSEAAKHLGVNPGKISKYLNPRKDYPFLFKYNIWFLGECRPPFTKKDVGKTKAGSPRPFKVKFFETGIVKSYFFKKDARKDTGMSSREFLKFSKGSPVPGFEFIHINDPDELLEIYLNDESRKTDIANKALAVKSEEQKRNKPRVIVTNLLTDEKEQFDNVHSFAESKGFLVSSINRTLLTSNVWREYQFEEVE